MEVTKTQQNLSLINFTDKFKQKCSLQKSMDLTKDYIWLGVNSGRMCLNQEQVEQLLPFLNNFVQKGDLI